ncbi:hypothetical protein JCM10003_247 [Bacteroides pyogenes JCM 10003]|nr:hypothetical protein JCM10003_247 [Bacteroides pyogenes JCM 10003]
MFLANVADLFFNLLICKYKYTNIPVATNLYGIFISAFLSRPWVVTKNIQYQGKERYIPIVKL